MLIPTYYDNNLELRYHLDLNQPKIQYSYDALGRVTQVTNFDGTTVRTYYQDRKTAIIDELNHQTIREVDALGRLVAAKQYEGTYSTPNWSATVYAQATYTYNVRDQLTDVYDPANNRTQIWYDTLGRKTSMSDPDMGNWSYAYDAVSNLKRQTDARNQTICFYYDALNRPLGKHYRTDTACPTPTPPSYNVSYTYDSTAGGNKGIGRRTGMSDTSGNTGWTYDARGRVTQETKVINGTGGGTFKTQLSYYADDQVYTLRYPADNQGNLGETVTTTYNPMGLVKSVAGTSTYVGDTSYNARGQVELRKLGSTTGVLTTDYVYRTDNFRLQWIKTGPTSPFEGLQNLEYTYDAVGNVQSIKDYKVPGGTQTQSFTYDALDRLLSATVTGGNTGQGQYSEVYTYNAIGNLTRKGDLLYDYYSNRPHAVYCTYYPPYYGYGTYGYDANGNMTSRTVLGTSYTLTYDAENRLTGVSGGASATFVYDGDGKRVKATFGANNTAYVGDYFEWTGSTSSMVKYYYANGQRVALRVGSTLYYLLNDHLGSTAITANSSGGKYAELRYKAYGETRYSDGTTPTTFRFTGQREEATIGLYYYGARYYDAALGRFIQADSIVPRPGDPQSLNRYSYVLNNPLRYTDPTGRIPCYGDNRDECSWAGYTDRPFSAATRRRDIRNYAHYLEKQIGGSYTALDALISLWDFATLFGRDARTTADDMSYVLVGAGGTSTLLAGFTLKGQEFLTGKSLNLPDFGDTGFHDNYRDWQNQPYHFWGYVNTTAQGGLVGWGIGILANEFHEKWDPSEALKAPGERGTSWEDYFLSFKGMEMGYLLYIGALSPDQAGTWMRRELSAPAGPGYTRNKATGTWWWPSVWMQTVVDRLR